MNWIRLLTVTLLLIGAAPAEDRKSDDKAVKEELKKLQGTWKATSAEMGGKAFTGKAIGMEKARFKGNKMTFLAGEKEVGTFEIKLAPSKEPKQMDWVKDKKYAPLPCIYELKDDELRICFPLLPKKGEKVKFELRRPASFETKDKPFGLVVLKREKPKEGEELDGSWLVVSGEADSKPIPEEEVKRKVVVTFDTAKLVLTEAGKEDKVKLTFKINESRKPKQIDITPETPKRGVIRGIYEADGDTLKICLGDPGKDRPKKFETKPGSGHKLMILKRQK
jgi:uncharacterized protein (TIGR03067 family)